MTDRHQCSPPGGTETYLLRELGPTQWRSLLKDCLGVCDRYAIHYPRHHYRGEDRLGWRAEATTLPGATVRASTEHADCDVITGPLSSRAREIFERIPAPWDNESTEPRIWLASFTNDEMFELHFEDFTVVLLTLPADREYDFERAFQPRTRFRRA